MVHGFTSEKPAFLEFYHQKPTEYVLETQIQNPSVEHFVKLQAYVSFYLDFA